MTNPIVYFRAFFTCCNEKNKFNWSIIAMKWTIIIHCEWGKGSYSIQLRTIESENYTEPV